MSGPVTPAPVCALLWFSLDPEEFPLHPSLAFDPAFDPYGGGAPEVRWLYFKAAGGEEAIRVVGAPEANPVVSRLGPDGAMYYLTFSATPAPTPGLWDTSVSVLRALAVEYGVAVPPPAEYASYQIVSALPVKGCSLFWDGGDLTAAVMHAGVYQSPDDVVAVVGPGGVTFNPLTYGPTSGVVPDFSSVVFTDQGVVVAAGGNPE